MFSLRLKALDALSSKKPKATGQSEGKTPAELFGREVFGDRELKEKLAPKSYAAFRKAAETGAPLDPAVADQVAQAMKEWALSHGATHFTHWFQPLTGLTAEKHDSFINFQENQTLNMNFSGKQLIKGEPDASSFPSGGSRSTFEARGYTVWDMESPSFLQKGANGSFLCIPTAFASWTGEALDLKTPLLRSSEALSRAAVRLLHLTGDTAVTSCYSNLGCEQEFFVIDRGFYTARPDLVATGRSLQGAQPPKGQQMEDHYFGSLDRRILAFMQDVEWRLWKLGVPTTTRHNEVAPSQYELAPIYEKVSVACDHNMLMMEVLRDTARDHDLACLLHEKPFAGVNGSGKHNNWSIATNTGDNLMDPGQSPHTNMRFIVFLTAVIYAVSVHGDVLRNAVAVPGNEHRLGANEAPPAIISIFMGGALTEVIDNLADAIESPSPTNHNNNNNNSSNTGIYRQASKMQLGVNALPMLPRDASDRNRTSPFAFTGNKFEFRAVGSSQSCARPAALLNTIVADGCRYVAEEIAKEAKGASVATDAQITIAVARILRAHRRVVFNGNGYSDEWRKEATDVRKLWHLKTLPEAVREFCSDKNLKLFEENKVLSRKEMSIQQHTMFETYCKTIAIEANCLYSMAYSHILPAALTYRKQVVDSIDIQQIPQKKYADECNRLVTLLLTQCEELKRITGEAHKFNEEQLFEEATFYRTKVYDSMTALRAVCDQLETIVDDKIWPFAKYSEILHYK